MKNLVIIMLLALTVAACKTSEANYRAAYDRAATARDGRSPLDGTIYEAQRRNTPQATVTLNGDTTIERTIRVKVTENGGGIRENLKPFSVAVAGFKQLFNAQSLRDRMADAGYPAAFVVETAEPYYYVILSSHPNRAEAMTAVSAAREAELPFPLRGEYPFILYCPR
ncbi:MAG: SPOR domain-containing protein [Muribaculaceae bacterium]|nr:SPOR domain-containing protein [Muribaculaceae bacterium]